MYLQLLTLAITLPITRGLQVYDSDRHGVNPYLDPGGAPTLNETTATLKQK